MSGLKEISIQKKCAFIPELLDVIIPQNVEITSINDIFLIMDLEETDLKLLMRNGANLDFGKQHVKTVLYNLLCAANFLESANVLHRDLKPANILINGYCQIKICDFGLSRTMPKRSDELLENGKRKRCLSTHISSRWFRAPEVCLIEKKYDSAIDVWSIGCIIYELMKFSRSNIDVKLGPIFSGDYCFPLSPKNPKVSNDLSTD
jgi:mitogen-activated protein kinase 1/3